MSDVRFTPAQLSAIEADNRELLVSAAAGSGKTAVLVERILRLIKDKHIDIDRMLVVTYTRAAAAELRERLELRLQKAAGENLSMARQLDILPRAQISTIHSYCQKVIKEHFRHCGVDPQFTIADDRTSKTLYQESLSEVLDSAYQMAAENPDLKAILEVLPEKQLVSVMDAVYQFLLTRPDPMEWMRRQAAQEWSAQILREHPVAGEILKECGLIIMNALSIWQQGKNLLNNPAFPEKYQQTISADFITLTELQNAASDFQELIRAVWACKFATMVRVKAETADAAQLCEEFKAIRKQYKDCVDEMKKLLPENLEAAAGDLSRMQAATKGLCWLMESLYASFMNHKLERAVLDFNDLEHMTLEVLADPELSRLESGRFDAVFVDEYQDVSAIQEAILNGLKRPEGQYYFYVGDVKQSIYRFRQAEPTLFLSKLASFSDDEGAGQRRIILNRNFRSRETVLDAVNRVFRHVMDSRVTEIDYDENAMLYPGKPSMGDPRAELHLISDVGKRDRIIAQARLVAQDIQRTVGQPTAGADGQPGAPLHYRDIVILLPVVKGLADKVEAELVKAGIPVYMDAAMNAMGAEEVTQVCQHLLLLDNLRNDLALIAELRSPLFDLSERELADIRLMLPEKEATFLDAVKACAEQQEDQLLSHRCRHVLAELEKERFLYNSMPVEEYLWDFLMRSGLYAHYGCQPGGKLRQANLRMLCHKASEYAASHTEGLVGFLSTLKNGGDSTSPTVVNPWEDVVRIMTIHKSKGLEFPTVYLMGLEEPIQKSSRIRTVSMHPDLGLSLMYMNKGARTKRNTVLQNVIDLRGKSESRAEKARVLYVAMTRPKNRLVMVACTETGQAEAESIVQRRLGGGQLSLVRSARTMADWILQSAEMEEILSADENAAEFSTILSDHDHNREELSTLSTDNPQKTRIWRVVFHNGGEGSPLMEDQNVEKAAADADLFSYEEILPVASDREDPLTPLRRLEQVPLKVGVTALCRAMAESEPIDPEEDTPERKRYPLMTRQPRLLSSLPDKPDFLQPRQEDAALQRGVCTHLLLSTVSLDAARQAVTEGNVIDFLEAHRENLRLKGQFTIQEAAVADVPLAARFLTSEEGRKMLCSKEIRREWPFNLRITDPIPTMVQGVIDLCYLEEEEWVLIDFKTDYVKDPEELWQRYRLQVGFYRQVLEKATGRKVRRWGLYSLRLGRLVTGEL